MESGTPNRREEELGEQGEVWERTGPSGTLGGSLAGRLKAAEKALALVETERDRLEATVVRLGSLAGQLDPSHVCRGLTETARELTGARLAMFVPAEALGMAEAFVSCEAGEVAVFPEPSRVPLLAGALWRVSPLTVDDAAVWDAGQWAKDQESYGRLADGNPLRCWLGAPARSRYGDVLGVLFLTHDRPGAFGKREEDLAQGLASYLGATLDNLSIFQERARVARALQQTLLPPVLPEVPGLEIGARYRPAREMDQVGGDFYDLFEVRAGVWGLLLGDVTGVGPEAAALTGIARYSVRALAPQSRSPGQLLSQLNRTLLQFDLQEKFCTALYAELRSKSGAVQLDMGNGGHPYPLVMRATGKVEEVTAHGTLLGVVDEINVEEHRLILSPGDMMVAYTDGVIEARNPGGEAFGTEGLERILPECAGGHASSVARRIELAVSEHQAGAAPDDVAIIVLQCVSPPAAKSGLARWRR
jgi:serine phosphatase RsbU (regulator of sigma subunit)